MNDIEALRHRFEVAVANFGLSTMYLKANEKAFQAWYAASVVQEFGMARVYREVHLAKEHFRDILPEASGLDGNEFLLDLSVSYLPNLDARHSATRDELKNAGRMLTEGLSIITEFKATGSTKRPTTRDALKTDIQKLARCVQVANEWLKDQQDSAKRAPIPYLVVLDNHRSDSFDPKPSWSSKRLRELLNECAAESPVQITLIHIVPESERRVSVDTIRPDS